MFRQSLLHSSLNRCDRKRWPMATAFIFESIIAAVIITTPLLSTEAISVSARVPRIAPLQAVTLAGEPERGTRLHGGGAPRSTTNVVTISHNVGAIAYGRARNQGSNQSADPSFGFLRAGSGPILPVCSECQPVVTPPVHERPLHVSELSPAQLVHRVEPLYPRTAVLISLQGEVKLHAIISRDGTIQSLSVTSGHPMLAQAALEAVRQWRYRPYVLNGQAVEVETFITVNFRRDR